jgi:RNA recognition motif-containing protein
MRATDRPKDDPKIDGDPLKTLFLARLSYDVTEKDLEQEFSRYGPIEKVHNTHMSSAITQHTDLRAGTDSAQRERR